MEISNTDLKVPKTVTHNKETILIVSENIMVD